MLSVLGIREGVGLDRAIIFALGSRLDPRLRSQGALSPIPRAAILRIIHRLAFTPRESCSLTCFGRCGDKGEKEANE